MKTLFRLLSLAVLLAGCGPIPVYHKAGVSLREYRDDVLACQVAALRDAPVATQIRRDPARYIPARRICDAAGNCTYEGGYWIPGEVYSVDVNESLRRELNGRCLAAEGYDRHELPRCPPEMSTVLPAETLPPLSSRTCVRRDGPLLTILTQP